MPHFLFLDVLVIGTIWFWLAALVPFFILMAFVENERSFSAFFTVIVTIALFIVLGPKTLAVWLSDPLNIAKVVGAYVALGIVWSGFKWHRLVSKAREIYNDRRQTFLDRQGDKEITPENQEKFFEYIRSMYHSAQPVPQVSHNKKRLIFWMSYWPVSFTFWAIQAPFRYVYRFFNFVYRKLGSFYQDMANSMFAQYHKDFEVKK